MFNKCLNKFNQYKLRILNAYRVFKSGEIKIFSVKTLPNRLDVCAGLCAQNKPGYGLSMWLNG